MRVPLIKGTQAIKGLFTFYRKDDKIYLEILPDQFDLMFLCSPTLESGIGERGLLSAQMLEEFVFTLHRLGKNVQFLKRNVRYRAASRTPIQRAVAHLQESLARIEETLKAQQQRLAN